MDQESNQIGQHKVIQVKTIQRRSNSPFSKTLSNNQPNKNKQQSEWKSYTQIKGKNQLYLPFTKNKTASNYARKYIINRPKNTQRQTGKNRKRDMSFAPKHQQSTKNELSLSLPTLKKKNTSAEKRKEKQLKSQFLDDQNKNDSSQENSQMVFVKFFNKRFSVQLQNCQLQHFFINQKKHYACFNTTEGFIKRFNEDRITVIDQLPPRKNYKGHWPQISFFGIYDGHGGDWVSEYLKKHLHQYIVASEHFPVNIKQAIEEGCQEIEKNIIQQSQQQDSKRRAGSCAVFAFIYKNQVCIGNIGDSRIVVSENQGSNALSLTNDHKPQLKSEEQRIIRNGGQVMKSKNVSKQNLEKAPLRVYPGGLSVSRTFGDFNAKDVKSGGLQGTIIAKPECTFYKITSNTDFLFLGCDGIYDIFTTQELVEKQYKENQRLYKLSRSYYQLVIESNYGKGWL